MNIKIGQCMDTKAGLGFIYYSSSITSHHIAQYQRLGDINDKEVFF